MRYRNPAKMTQLVIFFRCGFPLSNFLVPLPSRSGGVGSEGKREGCARDGGVSVDETGVTALVKSRPVVVGAFCYML